MLGAAGQRFKNTIHATVAIVATCLAGVAASPMQSPLVQGRLNPRIGIAAPGRYASVRDANDWKNDDAAVAQNLTTAVAILTKLDVVVMRWPGA